MAQQYTVLLALKFSLYYILPIFGAEKVLQSNVSLTPSCAILTVNLNSLISRVDYFVRSTLDKLYFIHSMVYRTE